MEQRHRETRERAARRAKRKDRLAAERDAQAAAGVDSGASEDEAGLRARAAKARRRLQEQTNERVGVLERELEHDRWVAGSVFEGTTADLKRQKEAAQKSAAQRQERAKAEKQATAAELRRLRFSGVAAGTEEAAADASVPGARGAEIDPKQPWAAADAALDRAQAARIRLQKLVLPELFVGPGPWLAAAGLAAVGVVGGAVAASGRGGLVPGPLAEAAAAQGLSTDVAAQIAGAIAGGLAALLMAVAAGWPLRKAARGRVETLAAEAASARAAASAGLGAGGQAVLARLKAAGKKAKAARDQAFAGAQKKHQPQIDRLKEENLRRLAGLADAVRARKEGVGTAAGRRRAAAKERAEAAAAARKQRAAERERVTDARRDRDAARVREAADRRRKEAREATVRGLDAVLGELERLREAARTACPPWDDAAWGDWSPPLGSPGPVRLGGHRVKRAELLDGIQWPDELPKLPEDLAVPGVLGPVRSEAARSVRVLVPAAQRRSSVGVLRGAVLRWLTTQPPGRVRLTLLDPVGLGESFAALMHLADADPRLVGGRIWSEPRDIDAQLAELTEHVAVVIQDRLRNEHEDIESFNAHAGPLAEPYRLLVVADYPHGFSPEAAARLENLAASGPRCGVFLAMSRDTDEPLPAGCEGIPAGTVRDLRLPPEAGEPVFDGRPLDLEEPPTAARTTTLVKAVGEAAKKADRVAVSFTEVTPSAEEIWSSDASEHVEVPDGPLRGGAAGGVPPRARRRAARAHRRQDRLGQEFAAARARDEPVPLVPARGGGAVPGRLQEGRGVQALRGDAAAARQGGRGRERPGLRAGDPAQARRADGRARSALPRGGRGGAGGLPAEDREADAPDAADRRRVPGAVRAGGPHRPGRRGAAGPAGAAGPGLRHARGARQPVALGRGAAGPGHARADGGADRAVLQRGPTAS